MAFPSVFPGDLDSYVQKTDGIDDVMAVDVNELQSAILAIETSLGVGFILDIFEPEDNSVLTYDLVTASWIADLPYVVEHGIVGVKHTTSGRTAGQVLIATGANAFDWSDFFFVGATGRTYTFPAVTGNVPLLETANTFASTIRTIGIGVGVAPSATIGINISPTYVDTSGAIYGVNDIIFVDPPSASSATYYGYRGGIRSVAGCAQNLTVTFRGIESNTLHTGSGTLTELNAFIATWGLTAGAVTTAYGLRILACQGTPGTKYPIYVADTGQVYFAGSHKVVGAFGCNGTTPQTAYSLGAACTDLATVVALANKLRLMAIANGTGSA